MAINDNDGFGANSSIFRDDQNQLFHSRFGGIH
jgi:hypothetical protein